MYCGQCFRCIGMHVKPNVYPALEQRNRGHLDLSLLTRDYGSKGGKKAAHLRGACVREPYQVSDGRDSGLTYCVLTAVAMIWLLRCLGCCLISFVRGVLRAVIGIGNFGNCGLSTDASFDRLAPARSNTRRRR